jgi:capsular exopolysaccharide synthesis family protein
MSQDIQLANGNGSYPGTTGAGVPAPYVDPFAANMGGGPGGPQQGPTPLQKIHRTLRGRYGLAIGLAVAGAAMGALAGYLSQQPGYKSVGMVEINPVIPTGDRIEPIMPMYQQYVQKQAAILQSQRVLQEAVKRKEWKEHHPDLDWKDSLKALAENLEVKTAPSSPLIIVSYTDAKQDVAQGAVKAVIDSYETIYNGNDDTNRARTIDKHREYARALQIKLETARAAIADVAARYHGIDDLTPQLTDLQARLTATNSVLTQTEMALVAAEKALANNGQQGPLQVNDALIDSIATTDQVMRGLLDRKAALEMNVSGLRFNYGEKHPQVQRAVADLADVDKRVKAYAGQVISRNTGIKYNADGTAAPVTPAQLQGIREEYERQRKTRDDLSVQLTDLGKARQEIGRHQAEIARSQQDLDDRNRQIDQLVMTQSLTGTMRVLSNGDAPMKPAVDKRKQFAFLGLVGGAGIPVGLLMLFGLLDSRYRYSDEANTDLSGLTLLGILPNLPDRLSDPEQASIAAHCVHQIRTMMQINTQGADQQAFAVTSAASGDGKTSLTLALGLSYAACGTRVLLIDCDLVGAGLTARMNVNATEGVLEAIANRSLLEYVRTTDIADVALLPVGSGGAHHASTLSPAALRRMVADAKKHFDVILIDTGPIMGSIEASLVCAAADGVVLAVARGQQRPLVERALNHLVSIGAKVTGVVFNRAQGQDFVRSFSGMSLRSGRNGQAGQFGPVAKAVASAYKAKGHDAN